MKASVDEFFSKCNHSLKKSLIVNFIFCAVVFEEKRKFHPVLCFQKQPKRSVSKNEISRFEI